MDPIDGTKGFLRGGQYAVCLALLIEGKVELGVIACPNLPVDPSKPDGPRGVVFGAIKGQGAFQRPISETNGPLSKISMNSITKESIAQASFCESVESGHSSQGDSANIAKELNITKEPVRMDSQAKYCSISRGDGDIYLRLPVSASYEEKIWVGREGYPFYILTLDRTMPQVVSWLLKQVVKLLTSTTRTLTSHSDVH